jgi:hypothetical protein
MIIQYVTAKLPALPHAGPIGDPVPVSPITGNGVATLLGYAMWGTIVACGVVALVAGGILAFGQLSNNPGHADRGKRALLYALGGVAIAAIAIPTLNTVFGTVHAS